MRKVIALEFISLDGVIQGPGSPTEDTSGGFTHGGWMSPFTEPVLSAEIDKQMKMPFDLLLGRKTFEIWADYWPKHGEAWPGAMTATKYVASNTLTADEWQPSVFISGNIAENVKQIKREKGADLHVYGSANLMQTLLKNDLVDALWLKIFPITLGRGKRLFADGAMPAAFKMTGCRVTSNGVIVANYERAGEVKTGSMV